MIYAPCYVKNISGSEIELNGHTFAIDEEWQIPEHKRIDWALSDTVLEAIINESVQIGDGNSYFRTYTDSIDQLKNSVARSVNPTSDLVCDWSCIKNFVANTPLAQMNYFERPTDYYIWIEFRNQKMFVPSLEKNTTDGDDFEDNYKASCNKSEAPQVRITTCQYPRKMHDRYITFTTSDQDNYDNTDWQEQDYGDVTYIMKDVNGNTTTNNSLAKETWIDWEPTFDYEILGGTFFVPNTLSGDNDDAWEIHVIGAPDLSAQYGGSLHLIANPRIKWLKGQNFGIDSSMNPAMLNYDATYHTNKIRAIIKHPVGAQTEFQLNLKVFK